MGPLVVGPTHAAKEAARQLASSDAELCAVYTARVIQLLTEKHQGDRGWQQLLQNVSQDSGDGLVEALLREHSVVLPRHTGAHAGWTRALGALGAYRDAEFPAYEAAQQLPVHAYCLQELRRLEAGATAPQR